MKCLRLFKKKCYRKETNRAMQYPLISEYVRAIQDASSNLDKLAHLVPVLDDHGEPYRSSGAFAVVFKMKDEQTGKCYALKCFTEEQEGRAEAYRQIADELEFVDSSYITSVKYLEKEIFVDSSCEEDEFPVLLMDWIDGETMETYIAENYQDNYAMAMLCYRFCKMAAWLRSQPFAHGDIKPDNIMVRPDGNLTLVDYDGMFVPAMKGQKSPTIGTKDFSHPLRTVDDFDETIDDFALASIALSLKAISLKPSLFDEYGAADRLLFSAEDYRDWGHTEVYEALREELVNKSDMEIGSLVSIFSNVCNGLKNIKNFDFVSLPLENVKESSTEVLVADLKNTIVDDFGVKYSRDKMKLLKAPNNIKGLYRIKKGTKIICNNAFDGCYFLTDINMPNSVKYIGIHVFQSCFNLRRIKFSIFLQSIGMGAFSNCHSLVSINIPCSVKFFNGNPFFEWHGKLIIDSNNFIIENNAIIFNLEKSEILSFGLLVSSYCIPKTVKSIVDGAFRSNSCLRYIQINEGLKSIGKFAFAFCYNLEDIIIPKTVRNIGYGAFMGCLISNQRKKEIISRFGKEVFGE